MTRSRGGRRVNGRLCPTCHLLAELTGSIIGRRSLASARSDRGRVGAKTLANHRFLGVKTTSGEATASRQEKKKKSRVIAHLDILAVVTTFFFLGKARLSPTNKHMAGMAVKQKVPPRALKQDGNKRLKTSFFNFCCWLSLLSLYDLTPPHPTHTHCQINPAGRGV